MTAHERAMEYQQQHPGVSYGTALSRVLYGSEPAGHREALAHMERYPGTKYEKALEIARGEAQPDDPYAKPPHHEAATNYMMQNPGMTYAAAEEHVLGKG